MCVEARIKGGDLHQRIASRKRKKEKKKDKRTRPRRQISNLDTKPQFYQISLLTSLNATSLSKVEPPPPGNTPGGPAPPSGWAKSSSTIFADPGTWTHAEMVPSRPPREGSRRMGVSEIPGNHGLGRVWDLHFESFGRGVLLISAVPAGALGPQGFH